MDRSIPINTEALTGKFFVGIVKVITDPESLGRVKVYIPELFENYKDENLPWFAIVRPVFRGASNNVGYLHVPRAGTKVICTFDKGNINSGLIFGELIDGGSKMSGIGSYPSGYGWIDESGTYFKVIPNNTLEVYHKGTTVNINSSGAVTINAASNISVTVNGNCNLSVSGNINSDASNWVHTGPVTFNDSLEVLGGMNVTGGSGASMSITGDVNVIGSISNNSKNIGNTHTHPDAQGGNTGPVN